MVFDVVTVSEDIRQVAAQTGISEVSVVGHDVGAAVAYAWAAGYPDELVPHQEIYGTGNREMERASRLSVAAECPHRLRAKRATALISERITRGFLVSPSRASWKKI